MDVLTLEDGRSRLRIVPAMGAGLASFEALTADGPVDVLRPWDGSGDPFALGCNLLVPFSNRISGGGFTAFEFLFRSVPKWRRARDRYPTFSTDEVVATVDKNV